MDDLRISSKDSEGAQTNMEYKSFPVSCVWERSGELEKEGKLYQGERQTMARREWYLKMDKGDSSMVIRIVYKVELRENFPTKKLGSAVLSVEQLWSR